MHKTVKGIIFSTLIIMVPFNLFALSVKTANTIQGSRPMLVPGSESTSLVAHSAFKLDGTTYRESDNSYNNTISFTNTKKLNEFTIIGILPSDFTSNYFYDLDGDNPNTTTALDVGNLSYRWIDNNNTVVNAADYNCSLIDLSLGSCSTTSIAYKFPLTLEITNSNVKVSSQYGDPDTSLGVMLTKSYLINYEAGFYAIKPASTGESCQWLEKLPGVSSAADTYADSFVCSSESTPGQTGHIDSNGGGYSSDYIPDIGFKPVPSSNKFPTVGFSGAEFQLVMIGSQSDYTFTVNPPVSGISVDSNGTVKLHSKPSSTVKIQAQHISSNVNYFYEFTISKWFEPKSGTVSNYDAAVTLCGNVANMVTRSDLTNSPIAAVGINTNWIYKHNYGTRAIDGSLYGEWGHMTNNTYPNSNWQNNRYWTKDINENHSPNVNKNFFVHSNDGGYISDEWADNGSLSVVCK